MLLNPNTLDGLVACCDIGNDLLKLTWGHVNY